MVTLLNISAVDRPNFVAKNCDKEACALTRQKRFKIILLSGKICLFILENTNFTNNTNPCGVLSLLIAYELHEYHPDGIRVIRL